MGEGRAGSHIADPTTRDGQREGRACGNNISLRRDGENGRKKFGRDPLRCYRVRTELGETLAAAATTLYHVDS